MLWYALKPVNASPFTDAQVLINTKNLQINDSTNVLSNWIILNQENREINPCKWTGIICEEGSVVGIDLSNLALSGEFPYNFCRIRTLKTLSLFNNWLNGTLSTESVSICSSLRVLNFSENLFGGALPEFELEFENLEVLDVSSCSFSGEIPISFGTFSSLKILKMNSNLLSGSIPSFLTNLTQLTRLELAFNPFRDGTLPFDIGRLTKLENLWLPNSNLIGEIPDSIGRLTSLKNLDLSNNRLSGSIPASIGGLKSADQILLYNNNLSGTLPDSFGECTSLTSFDVSQNSLTGELPAKVAGLKLEILHLNDNFFIGSVPREIVLNRNLRNLSLFNNSFSGELPAELGRFADLVEVDVSTNNFTGALPRDLCFRKKLATLITFSNRFSGRLPDEYGECDTLTYVRIQDNQLSGAVPEKFWGLEGLTHLDLKNNRFEGVIPSSISNASQLEKLLLGNNEFSGQLPNQLCGLSELVVFGVNGNNFSGEIPKCITQLKELEKLELQDNTFSGQLPGEVSSLVKLSELDVSNNQLTGEVPISLGSLPVLSYLDLSKNRLSGEIPKELGNLKLSEFNLSDNDLQGEVPHVFDNQFFLSGLKGNPELCSAGESMFPKCRKVGTKTIPVYLTVLLATVFFLLLGSFIWLLRSRSNTCKLDQKLPWKVIAFQRTGLDENAILTSMTDTNVIGSGGSGQVFKVELKSGQKLAVKQLWGKTRNLEMKSVFESEVETLGWIRHSNVVKLLYACSSDELRILVYEYMENGSLGDVLHGVKGIGALLNWPIRFKIALGAALGLSYLHHDCSPAILHRDIKSNNILLDKEFNPKLADFGLAKSLKCDVEDDQDTMSRVAGSFGYIAPGTFHTHFTSTSLMNHFPL